MMSKDKLLFTPGPLTTSEIVKSVLPRDLGSRDSEFINIVYDIRQKLLQVAGVHDQDYTAILMPGSGTFGVEAVISSCIAPAGKLLIIINGAYGQRIKHMADILKIETAVLQYPENQLPDLAEINTSLNQTPDISHVAVVHCETTTGIFNPLQKIGEIVKKHDKVLLVDAMSSFGAVPIDFEACGIHYLVSSANKCIEGIPGFSFILAKIETLKQTQVWTRSLSFDLYAQWQGLEKNGQFRFTPPIQSLMAFHQALIELEKEGGVVGRGKRYQTNYRILRQGMRGLGFKEYLAPENQGYIITTFHYPQHPNFDFETFYQRLSEKGFVIYPGKLTDANCFRIGNIGHIFPSDIERLLDAVRQVRQEMAFA